MATFVKGKKVRLSSGGPPMNMERLADSGKVWCAWFDGNELKKGLFELEALEDVRDERMPEPPDYPDA